jgi:hypothetical protein
VEKTEGQSLQNEPSHGERIKGKHKKRNFGSSSGRIPSGEFQLI